MFKKLLVVGVIAAAAVFVLKGTKFFGYAKQEVASWKEALEDQIPVEKKIAQMRKDVASLDKDIEAVKTELATAIVRERDLTAQTTELRTVVNAEQNRVLAQGEAIKDVAEKANANNSVTVKYGNSMISVADAKERLIRDVAVLKNKKVQLTALEQAATQHGRIKETLEKQFDEMRRQKEELKAKIDAVEAEYKALQLQQMESKYQTDDTRLARIKESLRGLQTKLDVEREKLKLTPKVYDAPVTPTGGEQSVDDILAPLTK
jgi:chromosome segregation ATPase